MALGPYKVRFREIRIELQRGAELRAGLVEPSQAVQRAPKIVVRFDGPRVERARLIVGGHSLRQSAETLEGVPAADPCADVTRCAGDGAIESGKGVLRPSQVQEQKRAVELGLRVDLHGAGAIEDGERLGRLAPQAQGQRQVAQRQPVGRVDRKCLPDEGFRRRQIARLEMQRAEEVQRIEMLRLVREDLAIQRGGRVELAALMKDERILDGGGLRRCFAHFAATISGPSSSLNKKTASPVGLDWLFIRSASRDRLNGLCFPPCRAGPILARLSPWGDTVMLP